MQLLPQGKNCHIQKTNIRIGRGRLDYPYDQIRGALYTLDANKFETFTSLRDNVIPLITDLTKKTPKELYGRIVALRDSGLSGTIPESQIELLEDTYDIKYHETDTKAKGMFEGFLSASIKLTLQDLLKDKLEEIISENKRLIGEKGTKELENLIKPLPEKDRKLFEDTVKLREKELEL